MKRDSGFNSCTHSPLSLARIQALRHPVLACYNVRARRRHTGCRRTPGVRVGGGQTSNLPSASGLNVGGGDRLCLGRGVLRPRCVEGSRGRCGGKATGDARSPAGGATARHRGRGPSARAPERGSVSGSCGGANAWARHGRSDTESKKIPAVRSEQILAGFRLGIAAWAIDRATGDSDGVCVHRGLATDPEQCEGRAQLAYGVQMIVKSPVTVSAPLKVSKDPEIALSNGRCRACGPSGPPSHDTDCRDALRCTRADRGWRWLHCGTVCFGGERLALRTILVC